MTTWKKSGLLALAILASSAVSYSQTAPKPRPLGDWLKNNPPCFNLLDADETGAIFFRGSLAVPVSAGETSITGLIHEVERPDGKADLIVEIEGKNAPITVIRPVAPDGSGLPILGFAGDGAVDFKFHVELTLDAPGAEIPRLDLEDESADPATRPALRNVRLEATGSGTFGAGADSHGFTPGTRGKVTVMQQTPAVLRPAHRGGFFIADAIVIEAGE